MGYVHPKHRGPTLYSYVVDAMCAAVAALATSAACTACRTNQTISHQTNTSYSNNALAGAYPQQRLSATALRMLQQQAPTRPTGAISGEGQSVEPSSGTQTPPRVPVPRTWLRNAVSTGSASSRYCRVGGDQSVQASTRRPVIARFSVWLGHGVQKRASQLLFLACDAGSTTCMMQGTGGHLLTAASSLQLGCMARQRC